MSGTATAHKGRNPSVQRGQKQERRWVRNSDDALRLLPIIAANGRRAVLALQCQHPATASDRADNALVGLAIRIHSIITNSGGCERSFSGFGITQSRIRNRLAVQSTHDINVVRMAVEAEHAANGHAPRRQKRRLGARASTASARNDGNQADSSAAQDGTHELSAAAEEMLRDEDSNADPASIEALEEVLCTGDSPDADGDDNDGAAGFPATLASSFTKIPLRDLFAYPSHGAGDGSALSFYWKAGIRDLSSEQEVLEAAAQL